MFKYACAYPCKYFSSIKTFTPMFSEKVSISTCDQQRFISVCASAQSDESLRCTYRACTDPKESTDRKLRFQIDCTD